MPPAKGDEGRAPPDRTGPGPPADQFLGGPLVGGHSAARRRAQAATRASPAAPADTAIWPSTLASRSAWVARFLIRLVIAQLVQEFARHGETASAGGPLGQIVELMHVDPPGSR